MTFATVQPYWGLLVAWINQCFLSFQCCQRSEQQSRLGFLYCEGDSFLTGLYHHDNISCKYNLLWSSQTPHLRSKRMKSPPTDQSTLWKTALAFQEYLKQSVRRQYEGLMFVNIFQCLCMSLQLYRTLTRQRLSLHLN